MPDDHPVLTWLVEHASTAHNLFHRSLEVKRHGTLDTVVVSGECHSHRLEKQSGFSKEVISLKQDGTKEIPFESKTIPLRKLWEMHQVFSLCKAFEEGVQMINMTLKI